MTLQTTPFSDLLGLRILFNVKYRINLGSFLFLIPCGATLLVWNGIAIASN